MCPCWAQVLLVRESGELFLRVRVGPCQHQVDEHIKHQYDEHIKHQYVYVLSCPLIHGLLASDTEAGIRLTHAARQKWVGKSEFSQERSVQLRKIPVRDS